MGKSIRNMFLMPITQQLPVFMRLRMESEIRRLEKHRSHLIRTILYPARNWAEAFLSVIPEMWRFEEARQIQSISHWRQQAKMAVRQQNSHSGKWRAIFLPDSRWRRKTSCVKRFHRISPEERFTLRCRRIRHIRVQKHWVQRMLTTDVEWLLSEKKQNFRLIVWKLLPATHWKNEV